MIKVLGASGSLDQKKSCITFQINHNTVIDAGNIVRALNEKSSVIEHVFLTHAHFDHIIDLPFLIESYFESRQKPLHIYATKPTIETLKTHIFNGIIWPAFHKLDHPALKQPLMLFNEIQFGQAICLDESTITPIEANHTDGACGYLVTQNNTGCLITGDTYLNPLIAQTINQNPNVKSLLIDVSFPSHLDELARSSKHLTPKLLKTLLNDISRPISVFPYHLKPCYEKEILKELNHPDFSKSVQKVLENGDEMDVFNQNHSTIQVEAAPTQTNSQQLQSLLNIATALSSETDVNKLLEMILQQAIEFSNADAGTLYRLSQNKKELVFTVVQNKTLDIAMGGTAEPIDWDNLPLYLENGQANEEMVATFCALNKKIVNIDSIYDNETFNFEGTKKFDGFTGYQSKSMLVIPLLNAQNELLGVLQLINKLDQSGQPIAFKHSDQQNTSALASQAAVSLTNTLLIYELETLFESVIATITKAFDEKCSFTGGHVRFVAELSQIISQGIAKDTTVYKNVNYTADDLHAIKIAALLHDVGKISTPEFIMQKPTKLQKNYDRVEVIGERLEIIKRDLNIQYLESMLSAEDVEQFNQKYATQIQELDDIYQYIKQINTGRDFLQQEDLDRISSFTRYQYQKAGQTVSLLDEDEVLNLKIRSGTLNDEERLKIMDHARVSLEILQTLPFPKKYEKVVNIAANHHEKLDGSGYPRGLTAKDIALEDRILILADLYEALSSKDRPYKEPNKLSKIFDILCKMANDGMIDKTLLRFFYESGTYKVYNRFLTPEQIDEITLDLH